MQKVILVGYMGCGKTTIAQILSEKTGFQVHDLDKLIEDQASLSINEIFKQKGEIYFRRLESDIFKAILHKNQNTIISTGGGTPCYANNHLLLNGDEVISVYLKASIPTLFERLKNSKSDRPLVNNQSDEGLKEFIAKHLFDRSYFYNQATHTVTVDDKSPETVADEIVGLLH